MDGMNSKALTIIAALAVAGLVPANGGTAVAAVSLPFQTDETGSGTSAPDFLQSPFVLLAQTDLEQQQLILELERQRLAKEREELEEMRRLQTIREQLFLDLQLERQRNQLPTSREQYQPQQYRRQDYRPQRGQPQQYQRQHFQPQQFRRQ
jgi:hypothetical protein